MGLSWNHDHILEKKVENLEFRKKNHTISYAYYTYAYTLCVYARPLESELW